MFELNSNITIGRYKRVKVSELKIEHSVFAFINKAVLKMPISSRVTFNSNNGEVIPPVSLETAKLFTEGMAVSIDLGYDGVLRREFAGFISRINLTQPLEVECEGYSYVLRRKTYQKTFVNANLKDVLLYLTNGMEITLDKDIADMKLAKLVLNQHNGAEALDLIKKLFGNMVSIWFEGSTLFAQVFPIIPKNDVVKYRLGWNVIKDNNLKLREAKNREVIVNYRGKDKAGNEVVGTSAAGSASLSQQGEVKEIVTHQVTHKGTLDKMATATQSRITYDGYEGKITAFLVPFCGIGWKTALIDMRYPERGGDYLVESVEVSYGTSGARRVVGIGLRV